MPPKTTPKRPAASAAKKTPAKTVKATKAVAKKAPAKAIKVASPAAKKAVTKATGVATAAAKKTAVATTKMARKVAIPAPFKPGKVDARMPGEQHPGQTSAEARLHDRTGSQLERERHQHPGSTTPKRGAARTNKKAAKKGR
jgi:hypothetical protein